MRKATLLLMALILVVAFVGTSEAQGVYIPYNMWDGMGWYSYPCFIPEEYTGWHTTCIGASFVDKAPKPVPPPPPVVIVKEIKVPVPTPPVTITKIVIVFPPVFFGINNKAVTCVKGTVETLSRVAQTLKDNPNIKVEIDGYTDSTGAEVKNQVLSLNRAISVQKYLLDKGISQDRMTVKGCGSINPIGDNKTAAGRSQNRRVEIIQIN